MGTKQNINVKLLKPHIKELYMQGRTVEDIITTVRGAKPSTVYHWVKKENWDTLRDKKLNKFTNAPEILLDMLYKMFEELKENLSNETNFAKVSDAILKITKSIKSLSKEKDRLSSVIFTMTELSKYINSCDDSVLYDAEFRTKLDKLLEGFQNLMLDKYSPKNLN